ncbi:hypothetical protein [Lysinibacillus fusiformis]
MRTQLGEQLTVYALLVQLTIRGGRSKPPRIEVSLYPALTVRKTPTSSGKLTLRTRLGRATDRICPIGSTNNP